MWALLATAAAVAVVAAAGRSPTRVNVPLRVGGEAGPNAIKGKITRDLVSTWKCKKGEDQALPFVGVLDALPAAVMAGPIGTAIKAGVGIVQSIFAEIGWKKVCTLHGGAEYRQLAIVPNAGTVKVWVLVTVQFKGLSEAWNWTFEGSASSTGELTLKGGQAQESYVPGPRSFYLGVGGRPPSTPQGHGAPSMWPHFSAGVPDWAAPVPANLDQPRVDLVRTDADLRLMVWLPPRAPLAQYDGPWKTYRMERPVRWVVEYVIEPL